MKIKPLEFRTVDSFGKRNMYALNPVASFIIHYNFDEDNYEPVVEDYWEEEFIYFDKTKTEEEAKKVLNDWHMESMKKLLEDYTEKEK